MTAAIFGLVGVIIGGLLNGAVTAWQARRQEKADGRVAARLVHVELRDIYFLGAVAATLEVPPDTPFPTPAWRNHQAVLARALSDKGWETVCGAYELIQGTQATRLARALTAEEFKADADARRVALVKRAIEYLRVAGSRSRRQESAPPNGAQVLS